MKIKVKNIQVRPKEHANPFFNGRQLRVSAPETSIHPTFSKRSEPRSSGRILIEEVSSLLPATTARH